MPRPRATPVRRPTGLRRRARLPVRRLRRRRHDLDQPRIAQVPQPIRDRIGLHVRRDLVHERLVRERVLQTRRRSQRTGEERRRDRVRQHALARRPCRCRRSAPPTQPVTYDGAALLPLLNAGRRRRRRSRRERRRLEAGEHAGDDVARRVVAGPAAERRRPRLVVPRDDRAVGVERRRADRSRRRSRSSPTPSRPCA